MNNQIYIEGLGYRNPLTEHEQIIWFLEQYIKTYVSEARKTKYWLDFYEAASKKLYDMQAFELIDYLKTKITVRKVENRKKYRLERELKTQLEWKQWEEENKKHNKRREVYLRLKEMNMN